MSKKISLTKTTASRIYFQYIPVNSGSSNSPKLTSISCPQCLGKAYQRNLSTAHLSRHIQDGYLEVSKHVRTIYPLVQGSETEVYNCPSKLRITNWYIHIYLKLSLFKSLSRYKTFLEDLILLTKKCSKTGDYLLLKHWVLHVKWYNATYSKFSFNVKKCYRKSKRLFEKEKEKGFFVINIKHQTKY